MSYVALILNLPWSLVATIAGLLSMPHKIEISYKPLALIIHARSFWYRRPRGVRAMTLGNVVLLGPELLPRDLEHELVHVEQNTRMPFIFPFLNQYQTWRHGYRDNKYEQEAYKVAGNKYLNT